MKDFKKIWVNDEYPDKKYFWAKEFTTTGEFVGWNKYHQNKKGGWTKRAVFKADWKEDICPYMLPFKEFEEIDRLAKSI